MAAGIGHIAHGTDIAGSIRYPAYACGVHGLRPTLGRVAANAALPERSLGGQITAVSGPLARSIADLRLGLAAMAAPDPRDPWWAPAPLEAGRAEARGAVFLSRWPGDRARGGQGAAGRGPTPGRAGWRVDTLDAIPPLKEAADLQIRMWLADGYDAMVEAARKEGDRGARSRWPGSANAPPAWTWRYSALLTRRATLTRQWELFFAEYPVLLLPVSAELPFPDQLDLAGDEAYARVWRAQMPQIGVPFMGLPALSVAMGSVSGAKGTIPVGVQLMAGRYREDLCGRGRGDRGGGPADRHRRTRSLRSASKPDADAAASLEV